MSNNEYAKDNKDKYDNFKIMNNSLVNIDKYKLKETNKLPIITNISYDDIGNVNLDNHIYLYLKDESTNKKNYPKLDIISANYKNIIIYKYTDSSTYNCYIINNVKLEDLILNEYNYDNNTEEYYLKKKDKDEYIKFNIFIWLIIIKINSENLIIIDYCKISPLNIMPGNKNSEEIPITIKEFENLKKLVITKAIYDDNPFDYLSYPPS